MQFLWRFVWPERRKKSGRRRGKNRFVINKRFLPRRGEKKREEKKKTTPAFIYCTSILQSPGIFTTSAHLDTMCVCEWVHTVCTHLYPRLTDACRHAMQCSWHGQGREQRNCSCIRNKKFVRIFREIKSNQSNNLPFFFFWLLLLLLLFISNNLIQVEMLSFLQSFIYKFILIFCWFIYLKKKEGTAFKWHFDGTFPIKKRHSF